MDLVEFLKARYDEDDRAAELADTSGHRWEAVTDGDSGPAVRTERGGEVQWSREIPYAVWHCDDELDGCPEDARGCIAEAEHIARHDPARVLAEVAAKRRIVDLHSPERVWTGSGYEDDKCTTCMLHESDLYGREYETVPCPTLRALGLPHARHPDYDESWRS